MTRLCTRQLDSFLGGGTAATSIPEAHPAPYPMGTGGSFPEAKCLGQEAEQSLPSTANIKNAWKCTSVPLYHGV